MQTYLIVPLLFTGCSKDDGPSNSGGWPPGGMALVGMTTCLEYGGLIWVVQEGGFGKALACTTGCEPSP